MGPDADIDPNTAEGEQSLEELPLFAYEEVPPTEKTREEIVAEKLAMLKRFVYAAKASPESDGSGAEVYLDTCERIHKSAYMKFPVAGVARDLRAERETVNLAYAGLGKKGAVALAAALRINAAASSLVLTGNYMTPSAAIEVVRAISESRAVTSLDLSQNRLGAVELIAGGGAAVRGGAVVNELLGQTSTLMYLSLRANLLTDTDVTLFADTLSENVNLHSIDLSDNKLGPSAAVALAGMLSHNGDLRIINLESSQFGPAASRQLLADGLLQNNTIKAFNLSSCGLDDACAQLIARIISENATEEITIANNRISGAGAEVIAKALSTESSLTSLVMDGNNLGESGCAALVTAAAACMGADRTLRLLSLQHCGCSAEIEEAYRRTGRAPTYSGVRPADSGIRVSEGFGDMTVS